MDSEAEEYLPSVNRGALVVIPTEVFLQWLKDSPVGDPSFTLARICAEVTVYLTPDMDSGPDQWLRRNFAHIFESELMAWCLDRDCWPERRTYQEFQRYFNIHYSSVVHDLADEPLLLD